MKNTFEYKGLHFYEGTPIELCDKLIELKNSKERVIFDFGETSTKTSWNEIYDISGRIGKTTGTEPMLILVHNTRSLGGGIISTNRVLSIKKSKGKNLLYTI